MSLKKKKKSSFYYTLQAKKEDREDFPWLVLRAFSSLEQAQEAFNDKKTFNYPALRIVDCEGKNISNESTI